MGFRGRDDWRDMSDYVVHFTKPPEHDISAPKPAAPASPGRLTLKGLVELMRTDEASDRTGYPQMMSILYSRQLRPGRDPLGAARTLAEIGESQRVVCFS